MAPSKKQLVTQFRTSGILQAARRVFGEKGCERATIDRRHRPRGRRGESDRLLLFAVDLLWKGMTER
jgi:hypothetical protein